MVRPNPSLTLVLVSIANHKCIQKRTGLVCTCAEHAVGVALSFSAARTSKLVQRLVYRF
jgi:hypothetical protein